MADAPLSLAAVHLVADLLRERGLPFAFVGGVALGAWGVPRATFDMDLAVSVGDEDLRVLLAEMERRGFSVDEVFLRGHRDRGSGMESVHVHVPAGATLMAIDLFLGTTPFLRALLERRSEIDLGNGPLPVCSAADLVLMELVADRPKDRMDVGNVLAVQGVPERQHLERWARELGVEARLRRVLAEAGAQVLSPDSPR